MDSGAQRGDELRLGSNRGPDRADAREHTKLLPGFYGQLRSSANVIGSVTRNGLTCLIGRGLLCRASVRFPLPGNLPMFNHVACNVLTDAGGGYPQNAYSTINRVDSETAVDSLAVKSGLGPAVSGLMAGQFNEIRVAIDPQGKFPCGVNPNDCHVTPPVGTPNFSRSDR